MFTQYETDGNDETTAQKSRYTLFWEMKENRGEFIARSDIVRIDNKSHNGPKATKRANRKEKRHFFEWLPWVKWRRLRNRRQIERYATRQDFYSHISMCVWVCVCDGECVGWEIVWQECVSVSLSIIWAAGQQNVRDPGTRVKLKYVGNKHKRQPKPGLRLVESKSSSFPLSPVRIRAGILSMQRQDVQKFI